MADNRIELRGRVLGAPELRTTPGGTAVLRIAVECANDGDQLTLAVVMAGEAAAKAARVLKPGSPVRVEGSLRSVRQRLKSGLFETGFEVVASSIEAHE